MRWFLLLLLGCDFSAATTVAIDDSSGAHGDGAEGQDSSLSDDSGRVDETGVAEVEVDIDGDGYSIEEGDCDDEDSDIAPGLEDSCDGRDTDCDGEIDEDAVLSDGYEPNDDEGWSIGLLEDLDSYALVAELHHDDDVDRFLFQIEDGWTNLFELQVGISGIPSDAIYELELFHIDGDEVMYSESGSDTLSTTISDSTIANEDGVYQVQIRSLGGADCAQSYTLSIEYTEWGL